MDEKQAEYLKNLSVINTPLFPFDVIESKINLLLLDRQILNKHPEDFPKEMREKLQSMNVEMAENLSFYVIQEIQDFYRQAYKRWKETLIFPETAGEIKQFRGEVIAHINLDKSSQIAERCIELETKYGFDKIYSEWIEFKNKIYKEINDGKLILCLDNVKLKKEPDKNFLGHFVYQVGMMRRCFYRIMESSFLLSESGDLVDEDLMVSFLVHIRAFYYFFFGSKNKDEAYAGDYINWEIDNPEMNEWCQQINSYLLHLDYKRSKGKYQPYQLLMFYAYFRELIINFIDKLSEEFRTQELVSLSKILKAELNR